MIDARSKVTLRTGNLMPVLGIGTWKLTDQTGDMVKRALQIGFRMVDTSGDYGTQPGVGDGIRASGLNRREVYLVTKVEETDDSYEATKRDLDELGMTFADLMLVHRPPAIGFGRYLWEGLIHTVEDGFAKDIGVSNYSVDQIQSLIDTTGYVPAVNQIEWTPFGHSMEMLGYCQENGIVIQAYSPLTRGERLNDPRLREIAARYEKTPGQVMLRWDLQLGVVPVVKAGNPDHLAEDFDIFDFELSNNDMLALRNMNEAYSSLGNLPYVGW